MVACDWWFEASLMWLVGNRRRSSLSSGRSSRSVIPRRKTGFRHLYSGAPAEADEPEVRATSRARFEQRKVTGCAS
jgi:hypothetical protein